MRVIQAQTVSEALFNGLHHLRLFGRRSESRNGPVLRSPHPVMTIYSDPTNRVLFSPIRDANPFFHVMETLWMLAGRNDLPWLVQFNSRFTAYSDDGGKTQPAAYGYRWRNYFGYDQLETLISELKRDPTTRRAVLTMWDGGLQDAVEPGEERLGDLLSGIAGSADVPCNTHAYFDMLDGSLNMTVCCRSNDIIWGAYGANAVHFSFLLEYVAAATGLPMGVYRQFSNDYHLYTDVVSDLDTMAKDVWASDKYLAGTMKRSMAVPLLRRVPLLAPGEEPLLYTLDTFFDHDAVMDLQFSFGSVFMDTVAAPMYRAYMYFKAKDFAEAIYQAGTIRAEDWRWACTEWLQRRELRYKERAIETNTFNQDVSDARA